MPHDYALLSGIFPFRVILVPLCDQRHFPLIERNKEKKIKKFFYLGFLFLSTTFIRDNRNSAEAGGRLPFLEAGQGNVKVLPREYTKHFQ